MRPVVEDIVRQVEEAGFKDILDAGEDEIKNICKTHCFDLKDITRRLRLRNHANRLLTIHLALDHTLSIFVSQEFVAQAVIDVDRWAVAQKIDLLFSMGLIDKGLSDALRKINSLRNKAAHKLNFRFSSADVEAVVALCSFPPEEVEEIGGRERFPVALLTILPGLDSARSHDVFRQTMAYRALLNTRRVLDDFKSN